MSDKLLLRIAIALPLINIVAGFSTNVTGKDSLHLGQLRGLLLVVIIIVVLAKHPAGNPVTVWMVSFFLYLATLLLASSNLSYSFNNTYIKVFSSMLLYVVGYHLITTYPLLQKTLKYFTLGIGLLCVNYFFAQAFKIGRSAYVEDSFYYGYAGIGSTVVLSYFVLTLPLFGKRMGRTWKLTLYLTMLLAALFTVIAMKRIAILAMVVGMVILVVMNRDLARWTKRLAVAALVLFMTFPFYADVLEKRFAARTTERNELKNEARYSDMDLAVTRFLNGDLKQALFGTELFNTPVILNANRAPPPPGKRVRERQVHVDYANLLIGAGAIGLIWYLLIHLVIWREFRRRYRQVSWALRRGAASTQRMAHLHMMRAVFTALLIASLVVSLSGGMHNITPRAAVFLLLGALTGILQSYCLELARQSPAPSPPGARYAGRLPGRGPVALGQGALIGSVHRHREIGTSPA